MAINLQQISNITKEACAALKGKTFGGVTKESAMEAIEQTARKVAEAAEEAIGKVQQEIQAIRGKTAREIADITSQKDAFCHQVQEQAAEAAAALKQAKAVKTAQKVLPNGHVQVRKVNKNGAVMVKEYNEQGQLLHSSVTTLDGSIRRTTYNPIDGKPVKTFTNASGKDMLIEYPANGKTKTTQVNNKKVNPKQKPALVSQTDPKEVTFNSKKYIEFERVYADGSKEVLRKYADNKQNVGNLDKLYSVIKYDSKGRLISEKYKNVLSDGTICTDTYNPETGQIIKRKAERSSLLNVNGTHVEEIKFDGNKEVSHSVSDSGCTVKKVLQKDENGFYTGNYKITSKFPKDSGLKPETFVTNEDLTIWKLFDLLRENLQKAQKSKIFF